jgi:tight adherence protein B
MRSNAMKTSSRWFLMLFNSSTLSMSQKLKFFLAGGSCVFVITYIFYDSIFISMLLSLGILFFQRNYENHLVIKRRQTLNDQFKDLLYAVSASVSSGRQLVESLIEAKSTMSLIYGAESFIVQELAFIERRSVESRETEDQILKDFSDHCDLEDVYSFIDVYFSCRSSGGDLEKAILKSAAVIMDKISVRRDLNLYIVQKKFEGKILSIMPIVVIGLLL